MYVLARAQAERGKTRPGKTRGAWARPAGRRPNKEEDRQGKTHTTQHQAERPRPACWPPDVHLAKLGFGDLHFDKSCSRESFSSEGVLWSAAVRCKRGVRRAGLVKKVWWWSALGFFWSSRGACSRKRGWFEARARETSRDTRLRAGFRSRASHGLRRAGGRKQFVFKPFCCRTCVLIRRFASRGRCR